MTETTRSAIWQTYMGDPSGFPMARTYVRTNATNERIQDLGEDPRVSYPAGPVEFGDSLYVETAADHAFSAFLAHVTPTRALRDRELRFSKSERKRNLYLRQKAHLEALNRKDTAA